VRVRVYVTLRQGILDPQGKAIERSLRALGFKGVEGVRVGRYVEVDLADRSSDQVAGEVKEMCEKLLANTIIEDYRFELGDGVATTGGEVRGG